jgi:hypothetical protein
MLLKKAAKKIATKGAVKVPRSSRDLRRAYEHLGRIEILEGALVGSPYVDVSSLANLAEQQLASGHAKKAAGLLRAAEHLCFAALAPHQSSIASPRVSAELKAAIAGEIDHLQQRAEDHWAEAEDDSSILEELYSRTREQARMAFARGVYRPALELARAAEALAHVTDGLPATLSLDRYLTRRMAS